MKLLHRYLLCVVALLLLLSAYCRPVTRPATDSTRTGIKSFALAIENSMTWDCAEGVVPLAGNHPLPHYKTSKMLILSCRSNAFTKPIWSREVSPVRSQNFLSLLPAGGKTSFEYHVQKDFIALRKFTQQKERSQLGRGLWIGALTGLVLGTLIGKIADEEPEPWDVVSPADSMLMGAVIGLLAGAIIGGTIGAFSKKRKARN